MTSGMLYRLTAFSMSPNGGNPAVVWIGEALPDPVEMQRIATDVGFSETIRITHEIERYFCAASRHNP